MTKKLSIKLLKKDTYLAMIKNSCGSTMWLNNYALINNKKIDIVNNGDTSCAFFVCSILKIFDLIKEMHVTVSGAEKDLKESGWKSIPVSSKMPIGSVIIWESKRLWNVILKKYVEHYHIGFYLGNEKAISIGSPYNNFPIIHHWTYNNTRKIIKAYWNPKIDKNW